MFGRFLVSLAVLVVGLGMVELIFGAWFNPNNLNRLSLIKDETLHYAVSGFYETEASTITYSRDKYGLRGAYGGDPSRIDLLTVGGSTTDQRYISDGSTWQDVLQQQFAFAGTPVVLANAGADGHSTFGHIKSFDWWFPHVPRLKPKHILFYIGLNDFHTEEGGSYDALMRPDQLSLVATVRDRSALWHLATTTKRVGQATMVLKIAHSKIDFNMLKWTDKPLQNDYAFMSPRLDAYAQRLRVLLDRTQNFGSSPLFVTQPSRQYRLTKNGVQGRAEATTYEGRQINGVDYYHMIRRFDRVTEAVARERNVLFIDLAAESDWQDDDFYDFYHNTPKGARKVGIRLFEGLKGIANRAK